MKNTTRYKCVCCGKITSGRMPRGAWHKGDMSERFPRRHKLLNGKDCPGNIEFADWVDVET